MSCNATDIFQLMLGELDQRLAAYQVEKFLVEFLNGIYALDKVANSPLSEKILPILLGLVFQRNGKACLPILDGISCNPNTKLEIRASIAVKQVEGLLNVVKRKHGLG